MHRTISLAILLALLSGCFPNGNSDPELENRIKGVVKTDNIITMDSFGQTIINIETSTPFDMPPYEQRKLSNQIAQMAIDIDSERDIVLVAFSKSSQGIQMLAFAWKNIGGTLELIEE